MTSLRTYPDYKPTGIDWLGDIPSGWQAHRLKRFAQLNPSKSEIDGVVDADPVTFVPMERLGTDGKIDSSVTRPFGEVKSGLTYFANGDVILAKITPCFENGKSAVAKDLPGGHAFGSTEYHVIRPNALLDASFLYRLVSSGPFLLTGEEFMEGSAGQKRVPTDFLANFPIPLPPLDEQRVIAEFLDAMDERITRFIDARRRMIALLEEQKQAIINQAVTRGLDPSVPMKPSGIDWLGDIPAHWEVRRIKSLYQEVDERSESGVEQQLSVSHLTGVTRRSEKSVTMFQAESYEGHKVCKPDDLVINTMWAWMGALGVSRHIGLVSPSYAVYRLRRHDATVPSYFHTLLRTKSFRQ